MQYSCYESYDYKLNDFSRNQQLNRFYKTDCFKKQKITHELFKKLNSQYYLINIIKLNKLIYHVNIILI